MSNIDQGQKPVKLVGAVAQAFRVLRVLSANPERLGVSAIAREAKVNPSTAFNILRTLVVEDAVQFDEPSKSYALGRGLLSLCTRLLEQSLVQNIRADLDRIASETNCLIGLWQVDDGRMVLAERAVSDRAVRLDMNVKQKLPRFAGAVGRAWAAVVKPSEADLRAGFAAVRWEGQINVRTYIAEVRQAQTLGYATDNEALVPGVVSVGTIIVDKDGKPIFGLSASDIAKNLDQAKIDALGKELASLARVYST